MKKLNCWEFKKCGRQPGGEHVTDMGLVPQPSKKGSMEYMKVAMAAGPAGLSQERFAREKNRAPSPRN